MSSGPYLFRSEPLLVSRVWGGRRLEELFGKQLPGPGPFGESWEVADLPEGQSLVGSGPMQGKTLGEVSELWGRELVGTQAPEARRFPLLVKLLDACRDLSVQVHPGPSDLEALPPGARSKDEAWVVLHSDGGEIIHGLSRDGLSADELRGAAKEGELEGFLERLGVKAGDVVRVSPGTIHAICAGVALLEVQEPSDTTYRIYDYGRPGLDGRPRQLHLEEALQVASLRRSRRVVVSPEALGPGHELLVSAPGYRIERLTTAGPAEWAWAVEEGSAQVLQSFQGALSLTGSQGEEVSLAPFQTVVIPAAAKEIRLRTSADAVVVVAGLSAPRPLLSKLRRLEREATAL